MTSIKDQAQGYEPQQIKTIAELPIVSTDAKITDETFKKGTDDEFTVKVIRKDDELYRVPVTVLKSLKAILEDKPDLKFFKVKKSGEGLKTEYTVIPVE